MQKVLELDATTSLWSQLERTLHARSFKAKRDHVGLVASSANSSRCKPLYNTRPTTKLRFIQNPYKIFKKITRQHCRIKQYRSNGTIITGEACSVKNVPSRNAFAVS